MVAVPRVKEQRAHSCDDLARLDLGSHLDVPDPSIRQTCPRQTGGPNALGPAAPLGAGNDFTKNALNAQSRGTSRRERDYSPSTLANRSFAAHSPS